MKNSKASQSILSDNSNLNFTIVFYSMFILIIFTFYSCGRKPSLPPQQTANQQIVKSTPDELITKRIDESEVTPSQEGYIYQPRDRRDPFVPLIMPTEKLREKEDRKVGTLESYDLGEFSLSAIAKKGSNFFALLVTPDHRSFTVKKGTTIGLNRGKVKDIFRDKVVFVEYSRDYKGERKPRQIILELHKGETE